jgi:polyisoprenoid-binding protein YceI
MNAPTGSAVPVPTASATALVPPGLEPGRWTVDLAHSSIEFKVRHLGLSSVRGRFRGFAVTLQAGPDLDSTSVLVEVDLGSIDTGNPDRDAHLRSTDFLAVDRAPTMVFTSTRIAQVANLSYEVVGDLELRSRTSELSLDVWWEGTEIYPPDGTTHAGFSARGSLSRAAHGIDFNVPMGTGRFVIGDRVDLEIDLQLQHEAVPIAG